jgi:hypothetical protein
MREVVVHLPFEHVEFGGHFIYMQVFGEGIGVGGFKIVIGFGGGEINCGWVEITIGGYGDDEITIGGDGAGEITDCSTVTNANIENNKHI